MFNIWLRTLQLSVKSLLLHPLRSSLTVLGIFIGVASVIWLLAIGEGIGRAAQEQIASLGAYNIIVRTIKPSSDEVQDAGYGLTRDDYLRLVATVPTIDKAIPIRIIPAIEFRNRTRHDRRPAGRLHARLRRGDAAGRRSRPLPHRRRRRRRSATTACSRPRWPTSCFPSATRSGSEVMVDERVLQGRRRDEAAGAVGGHRRLARGREFFQRRLHSDHHALAARSAT